MASDVSEPNRPGGPESFAGMVREHWNSVYKLLYTLTGDPHETDDLTQETFLRAFQGLSKFRPQISDEGEGNKLRAWLLRIASNAFFDAARKRKRRPQAPLTEVPSRSPGPEQISEAVEQVEILKTALVELTELTRLVFHLRVDEELSFREIGELAGISEEAARWHMHQARTKLMQRLASRP